MLEGGYIVDWLTALERYAGQRGLTVGREDDVNGPRLIVVAVGHAGAPAYYRARGLVRVVAVLRDALMGLVILLRHGVMGGRGALDFQGDDPQTRES